MNEKLSTQTPETHVCDYCGKELPVAEMVQETIWRNLQRVTTWYCKEIDRGITHAQAAQMSAEG